VTFEWIDPAKHEDHSGPQIGVIAQEVQKLFPQWVHETPDTHVLNVDPDQRTVLALTVESFREQQAEIKELQDQINGGHPPAAGLTRFLPNGAGWGLSGILFGFMMASKRKKQA